MEHTCQQLRYADATASLYDANILTGTNHKQNRIFEMNYKWFKVKL